MKIKKTVIVMGYECNNMCQFCCFESRRAKGYNRNTAEIKNEILNAKENKTNYLELIGGEPTIRKDIFTLIKYAKSLKFDTIMFATNGRMFSNKKFAEKIIELGVNHLVFSIHGNDSKVHDNLVRVPGSFKQLIKGIENVKELGFKNIGTNTTIVKQNYKYLPKIGNLIYSLGIRNSEFIFVDPNHGAPKIRFKELVPKYEEVSKEINELLKFGEENNILHWHIRYYPLCFIEEKYHNRISELSEIKTFNTKHIAPDFRNDNVEISRKNIGKCKINKCKGCKYDNICEGYWKEYVKQYEII
jgi:MoaA/NifB/PqqE/SkfB family radical SAM enzyme